MAYPIKIKASQKGSLRRLLGVNKGQDIPASDLNAKPGDSAAVKKKKTFAKNARKFGKGSSVGKLMGSK